MSSISLRLSNSFVPSSFPAQVLNAAYTQMDKVTKIAIVATLALALLVSLALCYAGKIKKWVQTANVQTQSNYQQQQIENQKAANIPLNRAKVLKGELRVLDQRAKTENELIEYVEVSPNIERIYLRDCVISKEFVQKIPKNVKTIDLTRCRIKNSFLKGLESFDKNQLLNLSLNLRKCDLKNVNFVIPFKIQELTFSDCSDVSLKSLCAANCDIIDCKNLLIDNETGDVQELGLINCPDVSLDHLPKTLDTLTLMDCQNLSSLEHLPENLKKLVIALRCTFINPTLGHLPKNLKSLDLLLYHSYPYPSLDSLPSGLQKLGLWFNNSKPTLSLNALPLGLQTLELHCTDKPSLDHLPQNLKKLEFNNCDLTNISFDSLPDSLKQITFSKDCRGVSLNNLPKKIRKKASVTD